MLMTDNLVVFPANMAKKLSTKTEQYNIRLTPEFAARIEAYRVKFKEAHGVLLNATQIFESAVEEYLDSRERLLSDRPKKK
jgi:hypothetical protein